LSPQLPQRSHPSPVPETGEILRYMRHVRHKRYPSPLHRLLTCSCRRKQGRSRVRVRNGNRVSTKVRTADTLPDGTLDGTMRMYVGGRGCLIPCLKRFSLRSRNLRET
jgi:hypothetical protein